MADPSTPVIASINPMLETNLHPLENPGAPGVHVLGAADMTFNLNIGFNLTTKLFTVNNASFIPPTPPVLLQILSKAQNAQDLMPAGSVFTLPRNKVIEISIPGGSPGSPVSGSFLFFFMFDKLFIYIYIKQHPFHLHGVSLFSSSELFLGSHSKKKLLFYYYYSILSTLSEVQEVQYITFIILSDATLSVLVLLGITRQFASRLIMQVHGSYIGSSIFSFLFLLLSRHSF